MIARAGAVAYGGGMGDGAGVAILVAPVATGLAGLVAILLGYGRFGVALIVASLALRLIPHAIRHWYGDSDRPS